MNNLPLLSMLIDGLTVKYYNLSETNFSSNDWALGGSIKLMQTRTHKQTYVNTRRVCSESVDGVGLETVQCVAQL